METPAKYFSSLESKETPELNIRVDDFHKPSSRATTRSQSPNSRASPVTTSSADSEEFAVVDPDGRVVDVKRIVPDMRGGPAYLPHYFGRSDRSILGAGGISERQVTFLEKERHLQLQGSDCMPTPFVLLDNEIALANYRSMKEYMPFGNVYYAVKANPAVETIATLHKNGSSFDVASPAEMDICLKGGVKPENLSYGNTIKKERDIAYAFKRGVPLYAFDCELELQKLSRVAPGAKVYCRVLMDCPGAEWPLSRKFGCSLDNAEALLMKARDYGLTPVGVSFHVGSQQTVLSSWDTALEAVAGLFRRVREAGVELSLLNMGGGFPCRYQARVNSMKTYANAVENALRLHFPEYQDPEKLTIILEPGRSLVGNTGVLETEVVLVSKKGTDDNLTWVYLDIGLFGGMAECLGEAIKYKFLVPAHRTGRLIPVVVAGPTCDSADIMYEKSSYYLPEDLQAGDRITVLGCGAYTTTYSSQCFNGFAPLYSHSLPFE